MTTVTETYISPITGMTYELRSFSTQKIYSPQEKRQVKLNNEAFYAQKQNDKLALQRQEVEAKKPKVLTEQERYELALEREKDKKAAQAAYEAKEAAKLDAHTQYLKSSPDLAQVTTTNFYVFQKELFHWQSRGYSIIVDSLEAMVPSLFSCQLSKPVATIKK